MALAPEAEIVDGDAMPDAGHNVLQDAPARDMEQHVVGRDGGHARPGGQLGQLLQPQRVVRPAAQRQREVAAGPEALVQAPQPERAGLVRDVRDQHRDQACAIGDEIGPVEPAGRLAAAPLAQGEQPAEPGVGRTVGRVDQHRHPLPQIEPTPDDQPHPGVLRRLMRPHDAREAVAVGDGQRRDPEARGLREQLLAGARPAQERKMRRHLQLGVAHPKTPCRNQRCEPVSGSSPSPAR